MGGTDLPPLRRHRLFETHDLDEAREAVARVYCPHRLTLLGPQGASALHNRVDLGGMSLNFMRYGADIRIDPGELSCFYLLQIPTTGGASVRCGSETALASPDVATLLSPALGVVMDWSADCEKILVQIDRGRVEAALEATLGRKLGRPLDFDVAFPRDGTRERIIRLIQFIREDVDCEAGVLTRGIAGSQVTETLIAALLRGQRHTYSLALEAPTPAIAPRHVKRAEAFMRENMARAISLAEIAEAAGVSIRALQEGFRRFRDTTPLETLRALRLEGARADLDAGRPGDGVTTIALRWGFAHLGRFAQAYQTRYGEPPSDTLRRGGGDRS
jgi:AraC-like DNA-binding protein